MRGGEPTTTPLPEDLPCRRVVLLGASNLVRGWSTLLPACLQIWGGPLDVLAARGHGRSYHRNSWVLGHGLPAIRDCALWSALSERAAAPTAALVTDIGNDLLHGVSPETLLATLEECLDRLRATCERVVVSQLPERTVAELPAWKFTLLKRLQYPLSRLDQESALAIMRTVNEGLRDFARSHRAYVVSLPIEFYAGDAIHISRRFQPDAWKKILSPWDYARASERVDLPRMPSRSLRKLRPHRQSWFGHSSCCRQPCSRLPDGSCVSLY